MSKKDDLSDEVVPSPDDLTMQERQFWLNNASEKYFEGKISENKLREFEEKLEVDYAQAALDQTSVRAEILNVLKKWIRNLRNNQDSKRRYYSKNDISTTENR